MKKLLSSILCLSMFGLALTGCSTTTPEASSFTFADTIAWDAQYDVVVAGFGGAGAVTAKTAADNGAKVLIVEKMSEGEAGGNTKVAGQLFAYGNGNRENTLEYYHNLAGDTHVDEEIVNVMVDGVTNMADILANDFGADKSQFVDWTDLPRIGAMSPEYPELGGSESIGLWTIHKGVSDSELYRLLKKNVADRADNIDVWFESPAVALIQDPQSKTVIGVSVTRDGKTMNIRALNGVVLCTGGFEDNPEMVENYLGLTDYAPIGGLYNTGDGIDMAMSVGADLVHMHVYEGGFGNGSTSFKVAEGEHAIQMSGFVQDELNSGSIMLVGNDGERFLNESETVRHGHLYNNGIWDNPKYPSKIWMVYDQKQADLIAAKDMIPEQFKSSVIKAGSVAELAEKIGATPARLEAQINQFNTFAKTGVDIQHGRDAKAMKALDKGTVYALELVTTILNTQGGPKRNANAEIIDVYGNPIPNLYSAGEMGGFTSLMYQGGTNLAECIIFGQIAGKNAATKKNALPNFDATTIVSTPKLPGEITDLNKEVKVETGANEYVGAGDGMGGKVTVKVTMDGTTIKKVEIVSHTETDGIADPALEQIPAKIVETNSADVDTISGATVTSKAIIAAVKEALAQVK